MLVIECDVPSVKLQVMYPLVWSQTPLVVSSRSVCGSLGRLAARALRRTRFTVSLNGSLALTSSATVDVENISIWLGLSLVLQDLHFMDCRHCSTSTSV